MRAKLILGIFGSPDKRQIDGLGGADPLTSKPAIISPSSIEGVDIDYTFAQVGIDNANINYSLTCGNSLAGVAIFAIDKFRDYLRYCILELIFLYLAMQLQE